MDQHSKTAGRRAALGVVWIVLAALPAVTAAQGRNVREATLIEVLKGNASAQEKDKACRELQIIGTPASIPALAALLTDRELSHMARYALEPMPYPQAGEALRAALGRTGSLIQVGIINSLGFREESASAPPLIDLLKASDAEVAGAAAAALGRIATPEAVLALERFRAAAGASLQAVAAEATLTAAQRLVRRGQQPAAARIYEELQAARWPLHVRQGAFSGLLEAAPAEAAARIARVIEANDTVLKPVAIASIPALKEPGAAGRFAAMLPRLTPEIQVLMIESLADCEPRSVLPALQKALASPRQEVKLAAVKALGKAGDASSVKPLQQVLSAAPSDSAREEAIRSLERLRGEGVNAEMLACMKAAATDLKVAWIGILGSRRATEALDDLLREARGGDPRVRAAALKLVGSWGGGEHLPPVLEILSGWRGEEGRTEAELAAARLARKTDNRGAQTARVLAAMNAATETPLKCSLLRVLGGIGDEESLGALRTALRSDVPDVRETALNTLMSWPDAGAIEPLLGAWRASADAGERTAILRSCVTLLRRGDIAPAQALRRYRELLGGAASPEDTKSVLSGLAEVADSEALELVEPALRDPETRAEAEWCLIQIADGVKGLDAAAARKTAVRLSTDARNEEVRKKADALARQLDQTQDYLMAWQVAGPYSGPQTDAPLLLNVAFPPETPDPATSWRALPVGSRNSRPWILDLAGAMGGTRLRAAYARTWVHSDEARDAVLELGVDDPVKVWLNGDLVHLHNLPASSAFATSRIGLSLRQGWNLLVLKLVQSQGPWEFSVRLLKPNGDRLEGLRYDPRHAEDARTTR